MELKMKQKKEIQEAQVFNKQAKTFVRKRKATTASEALFDNLHRSTTALASTTSKRRKSFGKSKASERKKNLLTYSDDE